MARILVTGGTGFLGSHLMRYLQKGSHESFCTTTGASTEEGVFYCNIVDERSLLALFARIKPDIVIHSAAISSVTVADAQDYYTVNTVGTENVIKAALSLGQKTRFLFVSTAGVYGNQDTELLHEALCPKPVHHYGMSKFCAERVLLNHADALDVTIIRPFNVIGEGQSGNFIVPKLARAFVDRVPRLRLGNLDVYRDYLDVQDAVELIFKLAFNPAAIGEVCNLCTGRPVSLYSLLEMFAALTGHELDIEVDPALVRRNEVWRLLGDVSKLELLAGGPLQMRGIEDSLRSLLQTQK